MKRIFFLLLLPIFNSSIIHSQASTDEQWYIKNMQRKVDGSGYYSTPPQNDLIEFKIGPLSPNYCPDCSNVPRKDLFIIYGNGDFYNSRPVGYSLDPVPGTNEYYNFKTSSNVSHLYLSSIYQEDDPPQHIIVENITPSTPLSSLTNTEFRLTANHDIIQDRDITLIIPNNLFDYCENNKLDLTLDLSNDFFNISNIFDNDFVNRWSFLDIPDITVSEPDNKITAIPRPTNGKYHFFNFKTPEAIDENLIFTQKQFKLTCNDDSTKVVDTLNETIQNDFHDPNFVKVECIYEDSGEYYIKYKVQFMNEKICSSVVRFASVSLNLPLIVVPGTIQVGQSFFGDFSRWDTYSGQLEVSETFPNVTFKFSFSHSSKLSCQNPMASLGSNPNQFGWVYFCVKANQDPSNYQFASLQPTNTMTSFEDTPYIIKDFIDLPHPKANNHKRPFTESQCDCKKKCKFRWPWQKKTL